MDAALAVGIDLGGTQVRAALVDRDGGVRRRAALRTDVAGGPEAVLAQFRALIADISAAGEPTALGIAAPGPLDTTRGVVLDMPTLPGWRGFPLRERLGKMFGRAVAVENDGIAAAYGEWRFGAGRGLENLVYVTVSTGIGGGVVVDGRLMHGRRGLAAHVGHFRLVPDGPVCSCGALGCFEASASGTALDRAARALQAEQPAGLLARRMGGAPADATALVEAARAGDEAARGVLKREGELLGVAFTGLIHLYSPDRLIMGGGVANAFDLLEADIRAVVRRDAMAAFRDVEIVPAALGGDAGLIGAASLGFAAQTQQAEGRRHHHVF